MISVSKNEERDTQVASRMKRLRTAIAELHSRIEILHESLKDVVIINIPSPDIQTKKATEQLVPLANELESAIEDIGQASEKLNRLIAHCEL